MFVNPISFTPVAVAALVSVIMALVFAYFPKVRVWFVSMEIDKQSLYRLGFLFAAEVIICLLSYYQVIVTVPPFSFAEAIAVAVALIVANKPVYDTLPAVKDVRVAMAKQMAKTLAKLQG